MNERTRQEGQLKGYIKGLRKAFKHFDYLLEEIDFSKSFLTFAYLPGKGQGWRPGWMSGPMWTSSLLALTLPTR